MNLMHFYLLHLLDSFFGCIESNEFCYAVKVNATLSQSSLVQRVADYFFDSIESILDSLDVTVAVWALAAFDFRQSCAT